jgi:ribosome-associated protein
MEEFTFNLKDEEYIEMIKVIKIFKLVGSGGEAKIKIDNGQAIRNGEPELRKRAKLRAGDVIVFGDAKITIAE